ncbi:MAG: glycosyl hydrolase family 18 protein [Thermotaleaceae bacterium]
MVLKKRRLIGWVIILFMILLNGTFFSYGNSGDIFTDVERGHWAEGAIYQLKALNVVTGGGDGTFGMNKNISRAEFITMLIKLLEPVTEYQIEMGFQDVAQEKWYYAVIQEAVNAGIIIPEEYPEQKFSPMRDITREEMAVMIVRALGYDSLGKELASRPATFTDVKRNIGYINIAKDLGIINGKSPESFGPSAFARREEAAVMMVKMYEVKNRSLHTLHGFYAINSYPQRDKLTGFNSIAFGWSSLTYEQDNDAVVLTMKRTGQSDYYLPNGYEEPYNMAKERGLKNYLMVFADESNRIQREGKEAGILTYLLSNEENQEALIEQIIDALEAAEEGMPNSFDGVVIDFEGLMNRENNQEAFTKFLKQLKLRLGEKSKEMMVCVQPVRRDGVAYFDGYNYREIGEAADKVILMAHDYSPKSLNEQDIALYNGYFPMAPIDKVYDAVAYAVGQGGVPREKLILQISLNKEKWIVKDGKPYQPKSTYVTYQDIAEILQSNIQELRKFDQKSQSPYIRYTEESGLENIIWYEDAKSVEAKIQLAKYFGLEGISIWRLGLIGDDTHDRDNRYDLNIWQSIRNVVQNQ